MCRFRSKTRDCRYRIGLLLLFVALMMPLDAVEASERRLLIVGDSLSDAYNMPREAGWAYLLSQRLGAGWQVINAAISGETTAGAAFRTATLIDDHAPSHILIILGGNDGLRALAPAQVRSNLDSIIERSRASGAEVALMQVRLPASLGPIYLQRFEGLYPELAETHGIILLPFFLEDIFDEPGMIMGDGIHPTEAAQAPMLEAIWDDLDQFLRPQHQNAD